MLYDIRLELSYLYDAPVHGARHLVRVAPATGPGAQRVIASSLFIEPRPDKERTYTDFFGNSATSIYVGAPHESLSVRLSARVLVDNRAPALDLSPPVTDLREQVAGYWSVEGDSPHHFLAASPRVQHSLAISAYAAGATAHAVTSMAACMALCAAIHRDFVYDAKATDVGTTPDEAFSLRRGVCQDFAHVMIAGLRGIGVPAGYVSGFLRTKPPPGKARLEGADAMHAWVRAWCGQQLGWVEFDPTNAIIAGRDHISIAHGRDYSDVSPIVGVLRTRGSHETTQSVDVIPIE